MLDASIFSKYKSKQDFDLERQEFEQRKRQQAMKEQLGQLQLQQAQAELSQPKMPFQGTGLEPQLINQKYMANLQAGMDKQQALQNATDTVLQSQVTTDARGNTLTRRPIFGSPAQINQMTPSEAMGMPIRGQGIVPEVGQSRIDTPMMGQRADSGYISPTTQVINPDNLPFDNIAENEPLPNIGLPSIKVDPTQYGVTSPYGQERVGEEVAKANIDLQKEGIERQVKKEGERRQEDFLFESALMQKDAVDSAISDIAPQVTPYNTGVFGGRNPLSQSGANIKALLKTIESDAALGKLTELKKAGGTLGQVTEKELGLLAASRAALDPTQEPTQFLEQLLKYQRQRDSAIDNIANAYKNQFGQFPTGYGNVKKPKTMTAREFLNQ